MTGLEKIVGKIAADSAEECVKILTEASRGAEQIVLDARNDARKRAAEIVGEAQKKADRRVAVAKSSAETITRTRYLSVRNAVVNDIISASYEELLKLGDKEYFELLFKLVKKNVETGECKLRLNARDLERLPGDFEEKINDSVFETAAVQVSGEPAEIENGFILDYGDFQVNCTLRSVFDENMDSLKDLLSETLFD